MAIQYTNEMKELQKIYKPYMTDCHLKEGAPKEAYEALEKFKKLVEEILY